MVRYLYAKALNGFDMIKVVNQILVSKAHKSPIYNEKYKEPFCQLIQSSLNKGVTQESYLLLCG